MFISFKNLCKYIYETLSERFDNLYAINKNSLEDENMRYCRMQDGDFYLTSDNIISEKLVKSNESAEPTEPIKSIETNKDKKIKDRMENYRK